VDISLPQPNPFMLKMLADKMKFPMPACQTRRRAFWQQWGSHDPHGVTFNLAGSGQERVLPRLLGWFWRRADLAADVMDLGRSLFVN